MELFNKMREKNIGLQLHYIPINKQPFYKNLGYGNEDTPIMNKYYDECFSLPMYSSLSNKLSRRHGKCYNRFMETLLPILLRRQSRFVEAFGASVSSS